MRAVGVRELKNRLSEYLRLVKGGEEILVTDRGEVVAELRQPSPRSGPRASRGAEELARQGLARLGASNAASVYPALERAVAPGAAARLLAAERGER
jgi:antitoxin (DNA-binding transcriptional repressor) of toxin-antitoxin stability system